VSKPKSHPRGGIPAELPAKHRVAQAPAPVTGQATPPPPPTVQQAWLHQRGSRHKRGGSGRRPSRGGHKRGSVWSARPQQPAWGASQSRCQQRGRVPARRETGSLCLSQNRLGLRRGAWSQQVCPRQPHGADHRPAVAWAALPGGLSQELCRWVGAPEGAGGLGLGGHPFLLHSGLTATQGLRTPARGLLSGPQSSSAPTPPVSQEPLRDTQCLGLGGIPVLGQDKHLLTLGATAGDSRSRHWGL